MPQFPYELWQLIISFLPVEIARDLYSVNRAFFDIAMNLRYQEAWIRTLPEVSLRKDRRTFRFTHLSSRPKTLHIDLGSFGLSAKVASLKRKSFILRIRQFVDSRNGYSPDKIVANALANLPRLTGVTKLYITYPIDYDPSHDPNILRLITGVWRAIQGRLKFLRIKTRPEMLSTILPPSLHLPHLETLSIETSAHKTKLGSKVDDFTPIPIITHFLSVHQRCIRHVHFNTRNYFPNLPSLFESLQNMHLLRSISLGMAYGSFCPTPLPLRDMLYAHRNHLQYLSLYFLIYRNTGYDTTLFHQDWCLVELPNLKALTTESYPPVFWEDSVAYIRRFARSLTTLSIQPKLFYDDVKKLSLMFPDFFSLRDLSISTIGLSPNILALLARTLPNLRTLNLSCSYVSYYKDRLSENEACLLFAQTMQSYAQLFSSWKLESLQYHLISQEFLSIKRIERTMSDCLPRVRVSRTETKKSDWCWLEC